MRMNLTKQKTESQHRDRLSHTDWVRDVKCSSSAWRILLFMKPSFLQQAKKQTSSGEAELNNGDTFHSLLTCFYYIQASDDRNITLLFVSYLLLKAKSSQTNFKWALQPFMVLRTPGRKWKACISWLQATSTGTLDLLFLVFIIKRGFCHSWMLCFHLSQSAATNTVTETIFNTRGGYMWAAAGSLQTLTEAGVKT